MKAKQSPIHTYLLAILLLVLPVAVLAQFIYVMNNGSITITDYIGSGGAVTIPDTINRYTVVSIGEEAFDNCYNMT